MKIIFATIILLLSAFSMAQESSVYEGTIDGLDEKYQFIVIDDGSFPLALNLKVKDHRGREVNRYALKPGLKVRYEYSVGANGYNQISSLYILKD